MAYQAGYGETSYDSNGYLNFLPTPDYGTNPWSSFVQSQQGNVNSAQGAAAGIPGMQQQLQSQMQAYQQAINATGGQQMEFLAQTRQARRHAAAVKEFRRLRLE